MRNLTSERLRELLRYEPREGLFYWRVERRTGNGETMVNARADDIAGGFMGNGYWYIGIDGRRYLASRLAWLYMTGQWPDGEVDHRNTHRSNNRWQNLRLATRSMNSANTNRRSDNTSGFKGVSYDRNRSKWAAKIQVDGRSIYLGRFKTPQAAHAAYVAAANRSFGEYARVN